MPSAFSKLRGATIRKYLDAFPKASSHSLARMIYEKEKPLFDHTEQVRSAIRGYRGSNGISNRLKFKNDKYFKNEIQPS